MRITTASSVSYHEVRFLPAMKKSFFQVVLLVLFGAFGAAGVAIFALAVGGKQGESIGPVTLWGAFDDKAMAAVFLELSQEDARVRSITYVKKNPETYMRELTDALASGTGPDLFVLRQDDVASDGSKAFAIPYENLSKENFQSLFIEAANTFLTPEGTVGIPILVDPLVMYWNRDIFSAKSIAAPPAHWDELFKMAETLTTRTQAGSVETAAIAFGEYQNVDHAKDVVSLLIMQAGGTITTRDSVGALISSLTGRSGGLEATESALRFYTDFSNPIKNHYSWNRSFAPSRNAFAAGNLALYLGYASEEAAIRLLNPNLNFAPTGMPQLRGDSRAQTFGRGYVLSVAKAGKNPKGALAAAYLLASKRGSHVLSLALGIPSVRRDVLKEPADGYDDLFRGQAIFARSWIDPDASETDEIFRVMIESVVSGTARLSEAVQRADRSMREVIDAK